MSTKYTGKVPFFRDSNYIITCTDEKFAPSGKGNPMVTLNFEVDSPDSRVFSDGIEYTLAGTRITPLWMVTQHMDGDTVDTKKTKENEHNIEKMYKIAFGSDFDFKSQYNPENPPLGFKGKKFFASLYSKEDEMRSDPTPEQLKAGQKQGAVQINPVTGQPRIVHRVWIDEIFGLAQENPTKPY